MTVGVSGTGGGFERFCAGETDISNASRPIKDEEKQACAKEGIRFRELHVANDGLTVVVHPDNDWAECLTVEQLKQIWEPGSKVSSWKHVDESFPDEDLLLFGPGTDSGTFDYFTDAIVGEEGASRSDYSATEDDNVIVNGVSGSKGGLGYLGLSYFEQNEGKLKAVKIDGGDGCVEPSVETVQDGSYKPLSRPLLAYARVDSLEEKLQVSTFLEFLLDNQRSLATGALFRAADRRAGESVSHGAPGRRNRRGQRMTSLVHHFFPPPSQHRCPTPAVAPRRSRRPDPRESSRGTSNA